MLSILKASAGSGKTYSLTRDYIVMLLGRKDDNGRYRLVKKGSRDRHRHILAVTFTNKATEEMKARIVHELAVLAGMEPNESKSGYESYLLKLFGCSGTELRERAGEALRMLLCDFNYFNVSTIDSFFQTILRTFAYEAELEGDYEVGLDSKMAVNMALDSIFTELSHTRAKGEKGDDSGWLAEEMEKALEKDGKFNFFNRESKQYSDMVEGINKLLDERFQKEIEGMGKYFESDRLGRLDRALREALRKEERRGEALGRRAIEEMEAYVPAKSKQGINSRLRGAMEKLASGRVGEVKLTSTIEGPLENPPSGVIKSYDGDVEAEYASLYEAVRNACGFVRENNMVCYREMIRRLPTLQMMKRVLVRMEQLRVENNTLLLGDTNSLLHRIIGDDDAPFVFERTGLNLHHFLIDEFQDTNGSQWDILRPLVNQSEGWGHDNLIIGDEKQSIYRFRGSDPSLIRRQVVRDVISAPDVKGDRPEENTNWRSTPQVVEFNNALFGELAACMGAEEVYGNVSQRVPEGHQGREGYVSVYMTDEPEEFESLWHERMVANMKRQLLEEGYAGGDICVLTRTNAEAREAIDFLSGVFADDEDLKGLGLFCISDDALTVGRSFAVKQLVSAMRGVSQSRNQMGRKGVDGANMRMQALTGRYEEGIGKGLSADDALKEALAQADVPMSGDYLAGIGNEAVGLSLPVLTELLVDKLYPGGSLPAEEMMYVLAFEDIVLDYSNGDGADLHGFLNWWDKKGGDMTISAEGSRNAVRVMTIHKSKGLEFKCVYLNVGTSGQVVSSRAYEWFEKEEVEGIDSDLLPPLYPMSLNKDVMEKTVFGRQAREKTREAVLDALNVLYVAFTRAVDELIVTVANKGDRSMGKGEGSDVFGTWNSGQIAGAGLKRLGVCNGEESTWGSATHGRYEDKRRRKLTDAVGRVEFPDYRVGNRHTMWDSVEVEEGADGEIKRMEGTNMHKLMAMVGSKEDVGKAVTRGVRMGIVGRDERSEVERKLREPIAMVAGYGWFEGFARLMNERAIVAEGNDVYRPDRVVVKGDGSVDVVDYKFGDEKRTSHLRQVKNYVSLLRKAGYVDVRGYVWYVNLGEVVRTGS